MATRDPHRARLNADINLIPMIDVLLVLLIIAMILMPALMGTARVQIPAEETRPTAPVRSEAIVLDLLATGEFAINGRGISADTLAVALARLYDGRPRSVLWIRTAANRKYQEFIHAADIARGAGVQVIGMMPPER